MTWYGGSDRQASKIMNAHCSRRSAEATRGGGGGWGEALSREIGFRA